MNENRDAFELVEKKCKKNIGNAKRRLKRKLTDLNQIRKFSSYVKNRTKARSGVGPIKINDQIFCKDFDIAQHLNRYFISVYKNDSEINIDPLPKTHMIISNIKITPGIVRAAILKQNKSGAPGTDNITARFLNDYIDFITVLLTQLFKQSLAEGSILVDWRTAMLLLYTKRDAKVSLRITNRYI